jgi:hypothetical protein
MDPWLEDEEVFPDLHDSLIFLLREALNASLPPGYTARARDTVWVDDELRREPDVALFRPGALPLAGAVATLPGLLAVGRERTGDPVEEPYLEILSPGGKRLVTAIEVVSLTNKRAGEKGRNSCRDKQHEFRLAAVNLVEIDLLRAGPHVTAVPLARLQKLVGAFD